MVERVLVPIDDSELARRAVDFVRETFPGAEVVLLHVINPAGVSYGGGTSLPFSSEEWFEQAEARAEALLEEVAADLEDDGIDTDQVMEVGKPTNVIVRYAADHDVDHVVMGSHGREGVTRVLLGSVAERVIRRSPVPVTVTR